MRNPKLNRGQHVDVFYIHPLVLSFFLFVCCLSSGLSTNFVLLCLSCPQTTGCWFDCTLGFEGDGPGPEERGPCKNGRITKKKTDREDKVVRGAPVVETNLKINATEAANLTVDSLFTLLTITDVKEYDVQSVLSKNLSVGVRSRPSVLQFQIDPERRLD
jgi:hypothetical protein